MNHNMHTLLTGTVGVVATECADLIPSTEAIQVAIQVFIGIATLVKMYLDNRSNRKRDED